MAHLGGILAIITALILLLREMGVFEDMRQRRQDRRDEQRKKRRQPPKVYDHKWPDDSDSPT